MKVRSAKCACIKGLHPIAGPKVTRAPIMSTMATASPHVRWIVDHLTSSRRRTIAIVTGAVALPTVVVYVARLVRWFRRVRRLQTAAKQFPHLPTHWLLGNLLQNPGSIGEPIFEHITDMTTKFQRAYSYFLGPMRYSVVCCHPETAKIILKTSEPKALSNFGPYLFVQQWLGDGLLVSSGAQWFRNRKLLTPAFHFDVLKPYMQIYNEAADKLIDKWQAMTQTDHSVEVYEHVSLCTLEVIMRCAFSYEEDVQRLGDTHPYVRATTSLSKLIVQRVFSVHLYPDCTFYLSSNGQTFKRHVDRVRQQAYELIKSRRKVLKENPEHLKKRYPDFLDILLLARDDKGKGLTDKEIRQEVDTFLFEGHDTTASAISWCLHTLAVHPTEQTLARKEITNLLEGRSQPDLEWDDLHHLPYLTRCVKESLRLNPPVPVVMRELTQPVELIKGTVLPTGSYVTINIYGIHHNPAVWGEDFREFKPERFLPDNIDKMDSHAFLPFSAGPRNCIGQNFALHEVKVIVARILHRFELNVDPRHKAERTMELVTRSKDGVRLMLTPLH